MLKNITKNLAQVYQKKLEKLQRISRKKIVHKTRFPKLECRWLSFFDAHPKELKVILENKRSVAAHFKCCSRKMITVEFFPNIHFKMFFNEIDSFTAQNNFFFLAKKRTYLRGVSVVAIPGMYLEKIPLCAHAQTCGQKSVVVLPF